MLILYKGQPLHPKQPYQICQPLPHCILLRHRVFCFWTDHAAVDYATMSSISLAAAESDHQSSKSTPTVNGQEPDNANNVPVDPKNKCHATLADAIAASWDALTKEQQESFIEKAERKRQMNELVCPCPALYAGVLWLNVSHVGLVPKLLGPDLGQTVIEL